MTIWHKAIFSILLNIYDMNKRLTLLALLTLFLAYSCTQDELNNPLDRQLKASLDRVSATGNYDFYTFPQSTDYASLPNQDPHNPITADKVSLGKMLFHETGLATGSLLGSCSQTYSCATCHIPSAGFTPGRMQGLADGGIGHGENRQLLPSYESTDVDAQGLRPLSILNVGYVTNTLWSGIFGAHGVNEGTEDVWGLDPLSAVNFEGLEGLESQNIEGLELHRLEITEQVLDEFGYRALFDECFPDVPVEERYNVTTASFALGAYLRTVLANESPFQHWLNGELDAMTNAQKRGALLFLGKARCYNCHKNPNLGSMEFHTLGTSDLYHNDAALNTSNEDSRNLGRAFFTRKEEDNFKFKVPQLYNLRDYTHFFHGSSKTTLREVIEFKLAAVSENSNVPNELLSSRFKPISLSEEEVNNLIDFLENGLYDPNLERYVPEQVLSGNCIPNNDSFSQIELGCQ